MRKKKNQKNKTSSHITRFNPKPEDGLKEEQIKKLTEAGLLNVSTVKNKKSIGGIFAKNIFTFFNMICLAVALGLSAVGAYSDMTFMVIVILNTTIGIVQEIRSKLTMDKLSLTNSNFTKVIRDGEEQEIYKTEVVLDDYVEVIGKNCFSAMTGLKTITFGKKVNDLKMPNFVDTAIETFVVSAENTKFAVYDKAILVETTADDDKVLKVYGYQKASVIALAEYLNGEFKAQGVSPIDFK